MFTKKKQIPESVQRLYDQYLRGADPDAKNSPDSKRYCSGAIAGIRCVLEALGYNTSEAANFLS